MKNFESFVKTAKTLVLVCTLALAASAAIAQTPAYYAGGVQYMSGGLLATNTILPGAAANVQLYATNFVNNNYFSPASPNTVEMGNGVFPISPAAQWITIQFVWQQYSNQGTTFVLTNGVAPVTASNTVFNLSFQPILDDKSLQLINNTYTATNNTLFTAQVTVQANSTNAGGVLGTCQIATTNFLGCKYGKFIGMSGNITNTLDILNSRFGEWSPAPN